MKEEVWATRKAIILGDRNFLASMQHVTLAISAILFQVIWVPNAAWGDTVSAHLRGWGITKDVRRAIPSFSLNILLSRTASGERQVTLGRPEVREMRQQLNSVAYIKYITFFFFCLFVFKLIQLTQQYLINFRNHNFSTFSQWKSL